MACKLGAGDVQPVRTADCKAKDAGLIIPCQRIIMDELGKWFMNVFTSINTGGRLGPSAALHKRVEAFLEQVGGEGVLKLSTLLNIGNTDVVSRLAASRPDLGEWLADGKSQKFLDAYFEEQAGCFNPFRKLVTRCLSFKPGGTVTRFAEYDSEPSASEAWQKVFQVLIGRENDDQESSDL